MEISRQEQIDARVEELRFLFMEGRISGTALDREIAGLAVERAALNPVPFSGLDRDGGVHRGRLESAITAFCHAYLSYQPRGND